VCQFSHVVTDLITTTVVLALNDTDGLAKLYGKHKMVTSTAETRDKIMNQLQHCCALTTDDLMKTIPVKMTEKCANHIKRHAYR